jgi:16S rRNA processing protein RimM
LTDKFIIGLVGAPFGVKGFVKVRPCSGEISHLLMLKSVTLGIDGKERAFKIEESNPAPPGVVMRFEGINSPEAAKTLNGAQLIAGREQAAPLRKGEFYIEDLKGLPVISINGDMIGHVTDIVEGGGGELVEIRLSQEQENTEKKLIPFRKEFFIEISPEKGKMVLNNLWILE